MSWGRGSAARCRTEADVSTPVTIAILNYQRRDALRRALEAARAQRYAPLELLVVDNASTDGAQEMVRDEFPDVHLVALPENIAAAARNEGVRAAKGEIVFTLDNDVLLGTPDDGSRGATGAIRAIPIGGPTPSSSPTTCSKALPRAGGRPSWPSAGIGVRCSS